MKYLNERSLIMEKDLSNQKQDSYSVDIQGNINGIQIQ